MENRKTHRSVLKLKVFAAVVLLLLIWSVIKMGRVYIEDRQVFEYLVSGGEKEIPDTFLEELWEQNGVEAVSAVLDIPVHMELEEYEMEITLRAVDTAVFPIKIESCLSELETGSKTVLFITPQTLDGLTDKNQYEITKSKKEELKERILGMTAVIYSAAWEMQEPEISADEKVRGHKPAVYRETGIFAAVLKNGENRVYIPYENGKKFLESSGQTAEVKTVYIKIRGRSKADAVKRNLKQIGFHTEPL